MTSLALPRSRGRRRFRLPPGGRALLVWLAFLLFALALNVIGFASSPDLVSLVGAGMISLYLRVSVLVLLALDRDRERPVDFARVQAAAREAFRASLFWWGVLVASFFLPIG